MNALHTLPAIVPKTSGLFNKGKAFVKFYKDGIMNLWNNQKASKAILRTYNAASWPELANAYVEYSHLQKIQRKKGSTTENGDKKVGSTLGLTRSELLTVVRTKSDFFKLPAFAVVFVICFELTPLVLMAFPRLAPSTCYGEKFVKKINASYTNSQKQLSELCPESEASSAHVLTSAQLQGLARTVLPGSNIFYRLWPRSALKSRLLSHLAFVRADDELLRRGDLAELNTKELECACIARGLSIDNGPDEQRELLRKWLLEFVEPADMGMLFGRPEK